MSSSNASDRKYTYMCVFKFKPNILLRIKAMKCSTLCILYIYMFVFGVTIHKTHTFLIIYMGYFIKKCVICIAFSENDINSLKKQKKKKISFLERNGKKGKKYSNMNAILWTIFVFAGRLDNAITLACIYSQYK